MVREITKKITKYQSDDGKVYDTKHEAEKADRELAQKNNVENFERQLKLYSRMVERKKNMKLSFPKLVTRRHHHGNDSYIATTEEGLLRLYKTQGWRIYTDFCSWGMYDHDADSMYNKEMAKYVFDNGTDWEIMYMVRDLFEDTFCEDCITQDYAEVYG